MRKRKTITMRILWLAFIVAVLATGAMTRDGKLFGHDLREAQGDVTPQHGDTLVAQPDGGIIVNTKPLAKDVSGYGGPVPLRIHVSSGGIVTKIDALPNSETPDFFDSAKELFARWQGKTVDQAINEKVDGVSGATFSSRAIIENVRRGLAYAKHDAETTRATNAASGWTVGGVAALIVALLGAIVPLLRHSRRWHYVQLSLNVVVLGLWTGTFVSYALFMRLFAGGVSLAALGSLAAPLVMVIVALAYPLAGKPGHYCAHMCPFGSAQELAGKLTRRKPRMSPRLGKALTMFRRVLWVALMALMLTGTWTAWMDYELFTAFLYTSAPIAVTVVAALFLILSVWVPRPYCRFVCPTGTLIKG